MAEIVAELCCLRPAPCPVHGAIPTVTVYSTGGITHTRRAWIDGPAIMQEVRKRFPVEEARIGVRRRWKDTITDHALGRNSSSAGCLIEDCLICCEVIGTGEGKWEVNLLWREDRDWHVVKTGEEKPQ